MFCVSILMDFSWEMLGQVLPFGKMGDQIRQCSAMHVAQSWTTKGSLANYTPIHRKDDIDDDEPRISKLTWSRIESNSPMQGSLTYGGEGRIWPESGRRRPASELLCGGDSASELLRDWW